MHKIKIIMFQILFWMLCFISDHILVRFLYKNSQSFVLHHFIALLIKNEEFNFFPWKNNLF